MAQDHYYILEISSEATSDEIKKAYRNLSRRWHPDKNPNNVIEATERFQAISEAYQVLINDGKRRSYDCARQYGNGYFEVPPGFFRSADEMFREFFGGKTLDEALNDFVEDPIFADFRQEELDNAVPRTSVDDSGDHSSPNQNK